MKRLNDNPKAGKLFMEPSPFIAVCYMCPRIERIYYINKKRVEEFLTSIEWKKREEKWLCPHCYELYWKGPN